VHKLAPGATSQLEALSIDIEAPSLARTLTALQADVVVHTAGPFQGQDYRVAAACIEAHAHYIDLADGRAFVAGVGALHEAAVRAGVLVTSGASSVPALSSAVADTLAGGMPRVTGIDIGISPGNRTDRGLATVTAILGYCGKPLPMQANGQAVGWRGTYAHSYPAPVGRRLLSPCDVPDLVLLGPRFPGSPPVRFGAGLELTLLHRGMNLMALLVQRGLVDNWANHAPPPETGGRLVPPLRFRCRRHACARHGIRPGWLHDHARLVACRDGGGRPFRSHPCRGGAGAPPGGGPAVSPRRRPLPGTAVAERGRGRGGVPCHHHES
jgi:hypothetical protein